MLTLSRNNQIIIGIVLAALVFITRSDHFATFNNLPAASLAVFFLAGFYLRSFLVFVGLIALCVGLDFYSITAGGVSSFCVTPAYGFLLPAYGVLWLAGKWFNTKYSFSSKAILPLLTSVAASTGVSELLSSGGFYFLGGRFENPTLAMFGERLVRYFPHQLEGIGFWLGVALFVHIVFALSHGKHLAKA